MSNETAVQTPERGPDAGAGSGQSDLARNAPLHGVPAPAAHPSSSAPAPVSALKRPRPRPASTGTTST
ncbi:hypothetical protein LUW77_12255 [Streptomyces radiopugnans]|nr:hypothetical protein LUW77_12255 [Streptomyces radiopugnans]